MSSTAKTLAELEKDLREVADAHDSARQHEQSARSETARAVNALNEAQRALDAKVEELRKNASLDSDWGRNRRCKGVAP